MIGRKTWFWNLAAALLVGLVCSGCLSFSGRFGTPIPTHAIQKIRPGETTRAEVHAWFGPPSALYNPTFLDIVRQTEGEIADTAGPILDDVYTYRFIQNESTVWFIPIFYLSADARATSETLTIFFDEQGRVRYHAYRLDDPRE